MPISATFAADFTLFNTAVQVAQTQLKTFEDNSKKVAASLGAMENSISGVKIVQAATVAAEAVDRLGGVTKLTYDELQRLGRTAQEAVEKMTALGQAVPTNIQSLADRARGASEELLRLGESTRVAAQGGSLLTTALGGIAGQLAGMFTVGAIIGFGREVLNVGDQIQKMADQTGLTTEQVQRLNYVAGQSGTEMATMVSAIQNLQQRLGDDASGAAGALKHLNINLDAFKQLNAYDQMITLAGAVQGIKDPTDQASTAAALFGKTWKDLLPAIKSGMADVAAEAPVMADATVKALDRVGDALTRAKQQAVVWGGALVLGFEQAGFALGDFLSQFDPAHFGVANSMLLEIEGHLNDPDGVRAALAAIPPIALDVAKGFEGIKLSAEAVKGAEDALTASVQASLEATKKFAAEHKAWLDDETKAQEIQAEMEEKLRIDGMKHTKEWEDAQKKATASVNATVVAGFNQIQKAQADTEDAMAKATLSSTDYQIRKVNEGAAAKIAAFKGTSDQVAQYSQLVMNAAARESDAIIAAASKALDVVAKKGMDAMAILDLAARQAQAGLAVDVVGNRTTAGVSGVGMQAPIYVSPPIYARAAGGPVSSGQPYLVGERGPEYFIPAASGAIVPNGRSGVVQNIVIHVNGTAQDVARQVSDEIMRQAMRGQQFGAS